MGTFPVQIEVSNREGTRTRDTEALVDTGAFYTLLPTPMLEELGIAPTWTESFSLADGSKVEIGVGEAIVRFNGDWRPSFVVFGPEEAEPLLGAHTLEGFGLTVDPRNQQLIAAKLTL